MQRQARQESNPDRRGWSSSCSVTPRAFESGRPGSNGPLRSGVPALSLLSYIRMKCTYARLESNQRPPPSQGGALSPLSYERSKEPPAGVEPAPRPYDGRMLPLTLRRLGWRRSESNRQPSRCKRGALPVELHPRGECGRVESNHHSARRQGYSLLSSPVLSVRMRRKGRPTGFEPVPRGSRPRMLPLHHGHHEAGTAGLEPAAFRLTSERSPFELRPR